MLTSSATIDGNRISANGTSPGGLAGICIRDQSFPAIRNNIIRANHPSGINIRDTAQPTIINNTLLDHKEQGTAGTAIKVNQEQGIQSLVIVNNIIADNDTGLLSQGGKPCTGNNFNNLYGNSTDVRGFVRGDQDISGNPLLSASFCLPPSSPCVDAGTATGAPQQDINGISRPQGPGFDIGACEYQQIPAGESGSIPAVLFLLL